MMTFFKREQVIRWLPLTCLVALFLEFISLPVAEFLGPKSVQAKDGLGQGASNAYVQPGAAYFVLILVSLEAVAIVSARFLPIRVRVRPVEQALPVTARRIFGERWLAVFVGFAVPFLAASLVWAWTIRDGGDFGTFASVLCLGLLGIAASTLLLFAYRPSVPVLRSLEALLLSLVAVGVAIAPAWAAKAPIPAMLVLGAAVLALGTFIWKSLPAGVPADDPKIERVQAAPAGSATKAGLGVRLFGPLRWTLMRSGPLRPNIVFGLLFGALLLIFVPFYSPFLELYLPIIMVGMTLRVGLNALHGLDALPMDRARVLNVIGLPTLAILVASMALSNLVPKELRTEDVLTDAVAVLKRGEPRVGADTDYDYQFHVRVPARYWRLAFTEADARVTAPWGESIEAPRHRLVWGVPLAAYCPYDIHPESSGRFLIWQTRRALHAVHGYTGSESDVRAAWFKDLDLDAPIGDQGIDELHRTSEGTGTLRPAQAAPNSVGLSALYAIVFWGVVCLVVLRNRPKTGPRKGLPKWWTRDTVFLAAVVLPVFVWALLGDEDPAIMPILKARFLTGINGALGSSPLLWFVLCAGAAAGFYLILRHRVRKIEVPPLTVSGWTKSQSPIY